MQLTIKAITHILQIFFSYYNNIPIIFDACNLALAWFWLNNKDLFLDPPQSLLGSFMYSFLPPPIPIVSF
jgi:hypothetical protein